MNIVDIIMIFRKLNFFLLYPEFISRMRLFIGLRECDLNIISTKVIQEEYPVREGTGIDYCLYYTYINMCKRYTKN